MRADFGKEYILAGMNVGVGKAVSGTMVGHKKSPPKRALRFENG